MPAFGSSADEPKTNERLIKSSNKKQLNKKQRYNKADQDEDEDDNSSMEDDSDDQNNGGGDQDIKYEDAEFDGKYREEESTPTENKKTLPRKVSTSKKLSPKMNQEEDDDEYYDDDYEENEKDAAKSSSTTTTTTTETPLEHYYSHFDSKNEHNLFKMAEESLKKIQLDKMKKVFKDYAEFQTRLSEKNIKKSKGQKKNRLGDADPEMDESLRKKMEKRYEDALESLEMQNNEEKQQLNAMHQQRVLTLINMKKQEATDCYTSSLNQTPLKPRKIQKCLEKLMKSLEKDRIHTLHHYKHLLQVSSKLALKEKAATLTHLENLIVIANRSISMLNKYPTLNDKIRNHIIAFWHNLRGVPFNQQISRETEQQIMEKYEEEIAQKQQEKEHRKMLQEVKKEEEKEREMKNAAEKKPTNEAKPQADHKTDEKKPPTDQQSSESNTSTGTTGKANAPANIKYTARHSTNSKLNGKPLGKQQPAGQQAHQQTKPAPANMQHSRQHHETSFKLSEQLPEQHHLSDFKLERHPAGTWVGIAGVLGLLAVISGIVLWRSSSSSHILSQGFVALQQQQQANNQQQLNNREQDQVEALQVGNLVNFSDSYLLFQMVSNCFLIHSSSSSRPPDTRTRPTVSWRTRT